MSFESIYLGNAAHDLSTSPRFEAFTGVRIANDEREFFAGNENGRVLEIECPFATQAMANNILAQVRGYSYQPYNCTGALINPAAEIGDSITVHGIYSGVFSYTIDFSALMPWAVAAESDEEVAHEFGYYDESDKYVTYAGLKNGTTVVNGKGLVDGSVTTAKTDSGINTSLGYANYSSGVWSGYNTPENCKATGVIGNGQNTLYGGSLVVRGRQYQYRTASVMLASGGTTTLQYLGPQIE